MSVAPSTLRVSPDRRTLTIVEATGEEKSLTAEMLRVMSPSAEVQGHSPEQRKIIGGKRDIEIRDIQPVGNYAVRIVFSDGHDSGYFTWVYLRTLHEERETRWSEYLAALEQSGLVR
ncbi:MAG: DUF971 domain-containing protein [Pseudomonadota bacterium]